MRHVRLGVYKQTAGSPHKHRASYPSGAKVVIAGSQTAISSCTGQECDECSTLDDLYRAFSLVIRNPAATGEDMGYM